MADEVFLLLEAISDCREVGEQIVDCDVQAKGVTILVDETVGEEYEAVVVEVDVTRPIELVMVVVRDKLIPLGEAETTGMVTGIDTGVILILELLEGGTLEEQLSPVEL